MDVCEYFGVTCKLDYLIYLFVVVFLFLCFFVCFVLFLFVCLFDVFFGVFLVFFFFLGGGGGGAGMLKFQFILFHFLLVGVICRLDFNIWRCGRHSICLGLVYVAFLIPDLGPGRS